MSVLNFIFNKDGTGMVGSAVLAAQDTARLISELGDKGLLGGVALTSGNETVDNACQDLIKAQKGGDPLEIARAFKRVSRAVQHVLKLRRNLPQSKDTTPRLEELPEAGAAAAKTLEIFPAQSANARYAAKEIADKSHTIEAMKQLDETFADGGKTVTANLTPLALDVSRAVRTVYDVVLPVADDDDKLQELTDVMGSYLKDPAAKAQDTKHLIKKHTKRTTDQVTQQVQSQARQQARDEAQQELTDSVKTWLDSQKK